MADVLLDTDIFVAHLRGTTRLYDGRDVIHYSVVTRAELFASRVSEESQASLLLAPFRELPVDRDVAEQAGRLRRDSGMRLPDALIAATALQHGCTLVTRNLRDFRDAPGLQVRSGQEVNMSR